MMAEERRAPADTLPATLYMSADPDFIDLAIAQVAGLGVIAAHAMDWDPEGIQVQFAAVSAALAVAMGLHFTEKRWPRIQEPLIGIVFILAATGGILILAGNPHAETTPPDPSPGALRESSQEETGT